MPRKGGERSIHQPCAPRATGSGLRVGMLGFYFSLVFMPIQSQGQEWPPERVASCQTRLELGSEWGDMDEVAFSQIVGIGVDPERRIYVLDGMDRRVFSFDRDGRFLRTFGGGGEGPAEFSRVGSLRVKEDRIIIVDPQRRRVVEFGFDGEFLRAQETGLPHSWNVARYWPLRDGWVLFEVLPSQGYGTEEWQEVNIRVGLQGPDRENTDTLAEFFSGLVRFVDPSIGGRSRLAPIGSSSGSWALSGDTLFAFVDGYSGKVEWTNLTLEGAVPSRSTHLPFQPHPLPEWMVAKATEMARMVIGLGDPDAAPRRVEFLPHPGFSLLGNALFSDSGDLWISRWSVDRLTREDAQVQDWIVFPSGTGDPYRVGLPEGFSLRSVQDQMLYGVRTTELDVPIVEVLQCEW